jgi:hypothetical protein
MTMSTTATLTALKSAEADLARAMESTAVELDAVGKGPLDEALARLQASAEAARQRLAGTLAQMRAAVAGVTAELEAAATDIWEDLSTGQPVPPVSAETAPTAETSTFSPDGDQLVSVPDDMPAATHQLPQEAGTPDEPATAPATPEPTAQRPAVAESPRPGESAESGQLATSPAEDLVLTAAACQPVEDLHDDRKPDNRPRGKRRRRKADAAGNSNGAE